VFYANSPAETIILGVYLMINIAIQAYILGACKRASPVMVRAYPQCVTAYSVRECCAVQGRGWYTRCVRCLAASQHRKHAGPHRQEGPGAACVSHLFTHARAHTRVHTCTNTRTHAYTSTHALPSPCPTVPLPCLATPIPESGQATKPRALTALAPSRAPKPCKMPTQACMTVRYEAHAHTHGAPRDAPFSWKAMGPAPTPAPPSRLLWCRCVPQAPSRLSWSRRM